MKVSTPALNEIAAPEKSKFAIGAELVKARLTSLVLLTTTVGFVLASRTGFDFTLLVHTLMGTGMLACGAAVLNQFLERDFDAQMDRTADRPLPTGEISPDVALMTGGLLSITGLVQLALFVNPLTAILGVITIGAYLFVYTPLKRLSSINTIVGAIPGALPPLMGWTAVNGQITREGWALFAILFFWQLPHFLAIAWLYREDYARAGFVMLPNVDADGSRTGRSAISHTLGLLPLSLLPTLLGLTGWIYFFGALLLGLSFLYYAIKFSSNLTTQTARRLFFASIIYLPLVLGLMIIDRI